MRSIRGTVVGAIALTAIATGCGDDGSGSERPGVCPSNLVIQTNWWPEVEHGGTYQLIGPGGQADKSLFTYSGRVAEAYAVGGIETVEVRAGGDAIEFQPVATVMRTDADVYLGYVNTDDAIASSGTVRVTGVAATLEINPQMLMWDGDQTEIDSADPTTFKESGSRVLHFPGITYIDWMVGKGYLDEAQSDPNYGGSPEQWIANGGDFVQQGFATHEVFKYENVIEWQGGAPAPVDYVLLDDLGWRPYPATYAMLSDRIEDESTCLELLVPKLQQAWVDYLADPQPINDALLEITGAYNNYWTLSAELNAAAVELFSSAGIGGNGDDSTYGNFDDARVEELFTELEPIMAAKGQDLPDGYTAASAYTNRFIDESIGVDS